MWQSIGDAIKIFLEKHLIPTVIAVVSAIVALVVLPSDYIDSFYCFMYAINQ